MAMFMRPIEFPEGTESRESHLGLWIPFLHFPCSVCPEGGMIEYIGGGKLTERKPPPWVSTLQ